MYEHTYSVDVMYLILNHLFMSCMYKRLSWFDYTYIGSYIEYVFVTSKVANHTTYVHMCSTVFTMLITVVVQKYFKVIKSTLTLDVHKIHNLPPMLHHNYLPTCSYLYSVCVTNFFCH